MERNLVGKYSCWPFQKCVIGDGGNHAAPSDGICKNMERRDSNRVKFCKRVNKVEPVYLEHCGTILQRSYVSFLSMSTEEDEDSALKNFVEKFVADTIRLALDKYIMDTL